jgi:hypothetical protein
MWGIIPFYFTLDRNKNPVAPRVGFPQAGSRDTLRSGGMQNWDMSLFKNIPLSKNEVRSLQLRLEAFNVFNHPNFNDRYYPTGNTNGAGVTVNGPFQYSDPTTPISIAKTANWGTNANTYIGVGGPRVIQLAAKVYF